MQSKKSLVGYISKNSVAGVVSNDHLLYFLNLLLHFLVLSGILLIKDILGMASIIFENDNTPKRIKNKSGNLL